MHIERLSVYFTVGCGKPLRRRVVATAQGRGFECALVGVHRVSIVVVVVGQDTRRRTGAVSLAGDQPPFRLGSRTPTQQNKDAQHWQSNLKNLSHISSLFRDNPQDAGIRLPGVSLRRRGNQPVSWSMTSLPIQAQSPGKATNPNL